jgi:hypothetical protein
MNLRGSSLAGERLSLLLVTRVDYNKSREHISVLDDDRERDTNIVQMTKNK